MIDDFAGGSYQTVLFKLSGELLGGEQGVGIDANEINRVAGELASIAKAGVRIGVVVGGGNFFRGGRNRGYSISDIRGHQMGMLFTVSNAIALEQTLRAQGVGAVVQSAIAIPSIVEQFDGQTFESFLNDGQVIVFAGGTGSTHFSTDTAASLRAIQIGADILLKATRVDGIYSSDPEILTEAVKYETLKYDEVLQMDLGIMDAASIALCREHQLPIRVFDATVSGGIARAGLGSQEGTLVSKGEDQ